MADLLHVFIRIYQFSVNFFWGGGLVSLYKVFFFHQSKCLQTENVQEFMKRPRKNAWFCLTCSKCRPIYVIIVPYPLNRSLYINRIFLKWWHISNTSTMLRLTIRGAMQPFLRTPSWRGALLSTETTLLFNCSFNILAQILNDLSKIFNDVYNSCSCHNCESKCYIYIL